MVSIERATGCKARFEANRPFNIEMKFKSTTKALPEIDWTQKSIVWLDYDGVLETDILMDARQIAANCKSGTIVAMSVNCQKAQEAIAAENDANGPNAISRFKEAFGRSRVNDKIEPDDLFGKRFAKLSRQLIENEINDAIQIRNSQGKEKFLYRPIISFSYKDDAPMTTVVGLIYSEDDQDCYEKCHFNQLDFLRSGQDLIDIQIPMLTVKELRFLENQLPMASGAALKLDGEIPQKDANAFANIYRYLPNFAALEV